MNIQNGSTSLTESNQSSRWFSSSRVLQKKELVNIYFHNRDGNKVAAKASVGDNLLDVIIDNDIDIDGFGACEGTMACSTCHLIFKQADYDSIPDKPTDEELDMLDLAYGLTDRSRLGCQVYVRKDMEGWEVTVPTSVADAREP
ncbi:adrenodoxin-like protein 2, mitochondrial [Lineus longissimus]|uniref:adrenodoxin-like protein 2, mitochondrial n=1 Tax=Lineus longissimus TaxID=88925 RepID=UPI00315C8BEB